MARHRPSEEESPPEEPAEGQPEVEFQPSPQMVEAVNQPPEGQPTPEEPPEAHPPEGMEYLAVGHDPAKRAEAQELDIAGRYQYVAEGAAPGTHVQLGELVPGETYEFTNDLHPEAKVAVRDLVAAGAFKKAT